MFETRPGYSELDFVPGSNVYVRPTGVGYQVGILGLSDPLYVGDVGLAQRAAQWLASLRRWTQTGADVPFWTSARRAVLQAVGNPSDPYSGGASSPIAGAAALPDAPAPAASFVERVEKLGSEHRGALTVVGVVLAVLGLLAAARPRRPS